MTRSRRPIDVLVVLALLASVVVVVGAGATTRQLLSPPEPLSVSDASGLFLDDLVLVRGYLVKRGNRLVLCDRPACHGPTLVVRGLRLLPAKGGVVVAGRVAGDRILPATLGPRRSGRL